MYKYSQSPPTLHHPATVKSIFERSFYTVPSSFALSLSLSLTHIHTHRHNTYIYIYTRTHARTQAKALKVLCSSFALSLIHTYTHTHRQKPLKSSASSQPSTYLLATILSKIVNH